MATLFYSSMSLFLYIFITSTFITNTLSSSIGINYGRLGNDLPTPSHVVQLLKSMNINKVKLYDADGDVLDAFGGSNIDIIVAIGNENIQAMTDVKQAETWIRQHIVPYFPQTNVKGITIGNEILGNGDLQAAANLLPAMMSVRGALKNIGLDGLMYVTSPHVVGILGTSYPPSSGAFREDLVQYIQPILNYHVETKSPLMINTYPFFAYKSDPQNISLDYALFEVNPGVIDPNTNLRYDNLLYAQIDAVYAAIKALGHIDIKVVISETGWPSKGEEDEVGATPENAGLYNGNLMRLAQGTRWTPGNPDVPVEAYIFALFNENLKTGKESERNFGLFYPNGTYVYNLINSAPRRSVSYVSAMLFLALFLTFY